MAAHHPDKAGSLWSAKMVSWLRSVWRISCAHATSSTDEVESNQLKVFWAVTTVCPNRCAV